MGTTSGLRRPVLWLAMGTFISEGLGWVSRHYDETRAAPGTHLTYHRQHRVLLLRGTCRVHLSLRMHAFCSISSGSTTACGSCCSTCCNTATGIA